MRLRSFRAAGVSLGIFLAVLATQNPAIPTAEGNAPSVPDTAPKFWKGNLHTHSFWSDGDDFPDMIADWYKSHGYNFLGMTEHNVIVEGDRWVDLKAKPGYKGKIPTAESMKKYVDRFGDQWVERRTKNNVEQVRLKPLSEFRKKFDEDGKFLMVPAEEISASHDKRPLHMNGINLNTVVQPIAANTMPEAISVNLRQVSEQRAKTGRKMIAFLNHPNFGWGVTAEDMIGAENLASFEVFNGHPGVRNGGDAEHASTERIWDIVLAHRLGKQKLPLVFGMATDDAHNYHQIGAGKPNPGRGWVMVRAPQLNAESLVKALEVGDFYSSSGVVLEDVIRNGEEYRLAIRTEPGVTFTTEFIATMKDAKFDGEPRKDAKGVTVTGKYSEEIGKVVARSTDANPSYRFTGKELYVRARITSTKPHPNPYAAGDPEMAWTQPVVP